MITPDQVKHIAHLARVHLRDEEIKKFTHHLEDILKYVHQLNELDVTKVEPTSHAASLKNVFRADTIAPSLSQEEALSIAVEKKQGNFKVPKVIE